MKKPLLNAVWAQQMGKKTPALLEQMIHKLKAYALTPVNQRVSYETMASELNEGFGAAFTGEGLRRVVNRHILGRGREGKAAKVAEHEAPVEHYTPAHVSQRDYAAENAQLREANRRLYEQVVRYKDKTEDLVRATIDGARDAMLSLGPVGPTPEPVVKSGRNHGAEAALWHLTDWQGGKKTASYNSEVMRERVMRFCRKAELITDIQRADHPVDECQILLGGDMIEGLWNFPTQAHEIDSTLFAQFVNVSRLLVDVVQYALSIYETVTVYGEWGNHGRLGSKRDSVPRADNADRMCYELARQLLSGETRLIWNDCPEDVQRVEIGNYRACLIHADEVGRNGFASPSTIVQHINRWKSGAYPWSFRDCYGGHYHTHYELALADGKGRFFGTGSTESENRYARDMLAASASPSQRLHFIDKERGRVSSQYQIYLGEDEA